MSDEGRSARNAEIEGRYSNYFAVGHNAFEFLFDFGQFYKDDARPRLHTKIVTSPYYASVLSKTLAEAIRQYERTHGKIAKPE